jgi:hypothetical protein
MSSLEESIGKPILIAPKIPFGKDDGRGSIYIPTLRGVDAGGVWIEHDALSEKLFSLLRPADDFSRLDAKPIFFLPYSEIYWIAEFSIPLDEKTLGL